MIGYKAVNVRLGRLFSWNELTAGRTRWRGEVEYKVGVEVYPREGCGPLAVFDTLEHALDACSCDPIYRCEYRPSTYKELWIVGYDRRKIGPTLPTGTQFASMVTLLEKVSG